MSRTESHWIGNRWIAGDGEPLISTDPATGAENFRGRAATVQEVDAAISAAKGAFAAWANLSLGDRAALVRKLAEKFGDEKRMLAEAISRETGKPLWESLTEVDAMIAKAAISIEAFEKRCVLERRDLPGNVAGVTRYRPHGVLGVLGPFNMPGHLPNGHIMPALLAGNTIVFKPSEQTPLVGRIYAELCESAGFPTGAVNLVQGARATGKSLVEHPEINGVLFTGSTSGGLALRRALADHPEKILALEMGGNNPLIVHQVENLDAGAILVIQSAFITAGQRCSCARRLILPRGKESDALVNRLVDLIGKLRIGFWNDQPQPFLGPVISAHAADAILAAQDRRLSAGANGIVKLQRDDRSPALLHPGLLDVTTKNSQIDEEIFGPLLQVIYVSDFSAAIAEANNTSYGLSAGLISDSPVHYEQFSAEIRAGVLSWNRPTTGASSQLSFGGIGQSGNHRPGGYFAADYCVYPMAAVESLHPQIPRELPPGISL